MGKLQERRRFLGAALGGLLVPALPACGGDDDEQPPAPPPPEPVPAAQITQAIAQLDQLVADLMTSSRVPGMAVAVVRGNQTVYAKGFGRRLVTDPAPVDADTVFQLASVSKSIGATVVARQVGRGGIGWDTPVRTHLPWFTLADAEVSAAVTIGDLYAHRSGLPDHAGDRLEDMGYDRQQVLTRLRFLPLHPFRAVYAYTNFGMTAAAEAVAVAAGTDWATLSEQALYRPLGMARTSSRFADYAARDNRAIGHVRVNGNWVQGTARMPDAQSAAGGVSASVNDMAKWLAMLLAKGEFGGQRVVDAAALAPAVSPQMQSNPPAGQRPAGYYGYGFNVGTTELGLTSLNHSGAFALGAATSFMAVPELDLAIVTLTNAQPIGVPETLSAQFFDLAQYGAIRRDWGKLYGDALAPLLEPEGRLVGQPRPANPLPARALSVYTGTYRNDYYGPLQVADQGGTLVMTLGATPLVLPLSHWDGDIFTFTLDNENAMPGTISQAAFSSDRVWLEFYDHEGLGMFAR
ncbi:CubicO group peptidase (beta-lactamase class C family) [Cupriavidus alkaliphilus]|uniref:serine hydrolase n=1 Tax=Cupriavidus alkaliphilus TaxID=942866 RepID=UPI000DE722EC|nr:serine hydrolase [Cupriavidus alkaliphilus]PVY80825.1 CubicO group peptidase (beta-lactamase class C family) [Cupriavidus alkaliphilus]